MLHVWYVYLDLGDFVQVNVGKLSSTMVRVWDMIKDPTIDALAYYPLAD